MKSSTTSIRRARIATAVTLISAAAAMAFVAAKPSASHAKPSTSHFWTLHRDLFETSLGKLSQSGEPETIDGPAQEIYDDQAYPATSIGTAEQLAASNAAKAIAKLPGGKTT